MNDTNPDGEFETPKILGPPRKAHSYHTRHCRTLTNSDESNLREATQSLIDWHELDECRFCSREYEPTGGPNSEVAAE